MAYKDLEAITESQTIIDYTDIFLKLQEKGMNFSQLKELLALSENSFQQIQEKKFLSWEDEKKIKEYLNIQDDFCKKEYYFDFPPTQDGISDKWKAIKIFEKMKAHNFKILVEQSTNGEKNYKLIGNVDGNYYEKEVCYMYDTSAIIALASFIADNLN